MKSPDAEKALHIYYTKTEIGSADIRRLFDCSASTDTRHKRKKYEQSDNLWRHRMKRGDFMAIIKDYYIGSTHIMVDDTYMVKTKEENDKILENIAKIWTQSELKQMMKDMDTNNMA